MYPVTAEEDFIGIEEAAALLRRSVDWLYRNPPRRGGPPRYRQGRENLYLTSELRHWRHLQLMATRQTPPGWTAPEQQPCTSPARRDPPSGTLHLSVVMDPRPAPSAAGAQASEPLRVQLQATKVAAEQPSRRARRSVQGSIEKTSQPRSEAQLGNGQLVLPPWMRRLRST